MIRLGLMIAALLTACSSGPPPRPAAGTLALAGWERNVAMRRADKLLEGGAIDVHRLVRITIYHDEVFWPIYNRAVRAVRNDLTAPASRELLASLAELQAMIPRP